MFEGMFASGRDRRVRPSKKSLVLSLLVSAGGLYLSVWAFGYLAYLPLTVSLLVALVAFAYRTRGLRSGLPEPYGRGKATTTDTAHATRIGLLMTLGGVLVTLFLFGSVFFLPPIFFLTVVFGIIVGLPVNEIAFFGLVERYEWKTETRIFQVTEETEHEGRAALVKSLEMRRSPRR